MVGYGLVFFYLGSGRTFVCLCLLGIHLIDGHLPRW